MKGTRSRRWRRLRGRTERNRRRQRLTLARPKSRRSRARSNLMDPALRVVTRIPLDELWTEAGTLPLVRGADLGEAEITDRLRVGIMAFAVANCGKRLQWIPENECYPFWKNEVKLRLVDARREFHALEDYPGECCYSA